MNGGYSLAVDLGSCFVAAATWSDGHPEMVALGRRSMVIPSVVHLDEHGWLLCDESALDRSLSDPERTARGFMRRLAPGTPRCGRPGR